ncbi:hypothetical protein RIF29_27844 [Crotalaria pallida]|uniref:Uncharacterized protein n=1 Tax=Crotalaria pallida TaxID=3830 RepID=A0AAN9ES02_CROPI
MKGKDCKDQITVLDISHTPDICKLVQHLSHIWFLYLIPLSGTISGMARSSHKASPRFNSDRCHTLVRSRSPRSLPNRVAATRDIPSHDRRNHHAAAAARLAREKLEKMGPLTANEKIMTATLFLTVGLWVFGGFLNIDAVTSAILGLAVLLVTGVVTWKECLAEGVAWDTLTWFAALIAMAGYLNKYGLISWFSQTVVKFVGGLGLSWQLSFGILVLLYFYSHYFFASGAAHIGAMFTAFLSVATALGTPPFFGAVVLSFLSNLMGGLTHYGIGSAPVFFGANYVPLVQWWGYGFLISIVNIVIWLGLGGIWWKAIGSWQFGQGMRDIEIPMLMVVVARVIVDKRPRAWNYSKGSVVFLVETQHPHKVTTHKPYISSPLLYHRRRCRCRCRRLLNQDRRS